MVKKLYTEANIQDIANAIRAKNGSSATYTTAEMPAAIRAIPTGSGGEIDVVNGIIEYYKAKTGTISANTFVEFVNGSLADGITVGQDTGLVYQYDVACAVALDSNRVFIVTRNSKQLKGVVCTISGTEITPGTDTYLAVCYNYETISAVALDSETVFIAYGGDDSGHYLRGIVCAISGTGITPGTETQLATGNYTYSGVSAVKLDPSTVFVVHRNGSYLYGVVCTISGTTTITPGTDTQLSATTNAYNYTSAVALDSETVFIAHQYSDALGGLICTISGTTITAGTDTQLTVSNSFYRYTKTVVIDVNKVFIAYGNNDYKLHGVVCTISGTTITAGTDTQLTTAAGSWDLSSPVAVDSGTVFVAHRNSSYLYGVVCTISGTEITPGTDTLLATGSMSYSYVSAVLIDSNKIFVAHRYGSGLGGLIVVGGEVMIKPSTSKIDGLTKTEATTSTAGDVWVLNT